MKLVKLIMGFIFLICLSLSLNSCGGHSHEGGDHDHGQEQTEATTDSHSETDGHDHDGHDHDGHDHDGTAAAHGEGAEFTSAYVCPMHCKGSGSDKAGTCPVCNMDYVALNEHTKDGHDHNE